MELNIRRFSVFFESFTVNHKADKLQKEIDSMKADLELLKQIVLGTEAKQN